MRIKIAIALASMLCGGLIYVLFRSESLLMFSWLEYIGLNIQIEIIRGIVANHVVSLPNIIIYSLPNALWYLSGLMVFSSIWGNGKARSTWMVSFSVLAIGAELGQLFGFVKGTYAHSDIALMLLAIPIYLIVEQCHRRMLEY